MYFFGSGRVNDPKDFINNPLGKLEINLELVNTYKYKKIIKPKFLTELYKYNRIQKELINL